MLTEREAKKAALDIIEELRIKVVMDDNSGWRCLLRIEEALDGTVDLYDRSEEDFGTFNGPSGYKNYILAQAYLGKGRGRE